MSLRSEEIRSLVEQPALSVTTGKPERPRHAWRQGIRSFCRDPQALIGLAVLLAIVLFAAIAPHLSSTNVFAVVGQPLTAPFSKGAPLLGTDQAGRSILAGLISGAAPTLVMAAGAGFLALVVGAVIGALGGYFGRWTDSALMRVTEATLSIPAIIFVLTLLTIIQPTSLNITLTVGLLAWPAVARVTRAEVSKLRDSDFVRAARVQGCSNMRILLREILPNVIPTLIVLTTLCIAAAMLGETGLAYLGVTNQNVETWGLLIGQNADAIQDGWWTVTFPGVAIALTVLSVNLVGTGLNRVLNPKREA